VLFNILDACREPVRMARRTQIPPDSENGPRARHMMGDRNFRVIVQRNMFLTETKQTTMTSVHPSFLEQTRRQFQQSSAICVCCDGNITIDCYCRLLSIDINYCHSSSRAVPCPTHSYRVLSIPVHYCRHALLHGFFSRTFLYSNKKC
jgi:hypothetical protein